MPNPLSDPLPNHPDLVSKTNPLPNPPPPPPISPHQMDILRAVTAMAWADGQLEPDEIRLILDQFAALYAKSEAEERSIKQNLRAYLGQNIPLDEVIPQLKTKEDRKLVLKLSYMVIQASRRHPGEPNVNLDEAAAYQRLVRLLGLPKEEVEDIEAQVIPPDEVQTGFLQSLAIKLHSLIKI